MGAVHWVGNFVSGEIINDNVPLSGAVRRKIYIVNASRLCVNAHSKPAFGSLFRVIASGSDAGMRPHMQISVDYYTMYQYIRGGG